MTPLIEFGQAVVSEEMLGSGGRQPTDGKRSHELWQKSLHPPDIKGRIHRSNSVNVGGRIDVRHDYVAQGFSKIVYDASRAFKMLYCDS